uniref:DUF2040 domain-containing protein n=1 Tax=Parastrongyloides trichosuri TaxID=131310 RepID=A0A0N4ZI87_PARTI
MSFKKFGLVLKKEEVVNKKEVSNNIFGFSDDEEEQVPSSSIVRSEVKKEVNTEDSDDDIYDYDGAYDQIQFEKLQKMMKKIDDDEEKKPKYIEKIMEAQKKRELDRFLVEERKIKKEIEAEKEIYGEKEVFVTSNYKKKLEEMAELQKTEEEKEREEDIANEQILKHGALRSGVYRSFLNKFGDEDINKSEKVVFRSNKKNKEKKNVTESKKSIYDDEEDDEMRPVIKPVILKPQIKGGLEIRKKDVVVNETEVNKEEDDCDVNKKEEPKKVEVTPPSEEKKPQKKEDVRTLPKEVRIIKIREIMKQRNSEDDIKAYRKRYMLRKLRGEIVPSY